MGKTTRRLAVLALCALLGCSSAGGDGEGASRGIGDGELPGAAAPTTAKGGEAEAAKDASAPTPTLATAPMTSASSSGSGTGSARAGSAPAATPAASAPVSTAGPAAGSGAAGSGSAATPAAPSAAPAIPASGSPPSGDSAASAAKGGTGTGNAQVPSSVLTAGAWDDNRNFDRFEKYRKQLEQQELPGLLPFKDSEFTAAHDEYSKTASAHDQLDVALVIDTTGSMGDEIAYLQSEFLALSSAIESKYPNAEQRWALVVYRDQGDEYVTRWFDFRDSAEDFRDKLAMQSARGGGDFPESPDAAFETAAQLGWREDAKVARLAFWVADAPHHNDKASAMAAAIRGIHELGVHVYPVASSGVDELTEISMRSAAQLTGGRYLFLTDDSSIGGSHKEPSIPCYFVTKLDKAILRMVDIEMTGKYTEPAGDDIIRTSGKPTNGSCDLESGETVQAF